MRKPIAQLMGESNAGEPAARIRQVEANFDHGSVSIACQLARRTAVSGRVGPFRPLVLTIPRG
jgi:hypothetical protein